MNEAIAMQKIVILPTGSTEQLNPHLALGIDVFLVETVRLEVGTARPTACWSCHA